MKGVVFTEFIEMSEDQFGFETVDRVIRKSKLPSHGIYTAVGTYDHSEIVALVTNLSQESGLGVADLVQTFGRHLMKRFTEMFPDFFDVSDVLEFLEHVDGYIHGEVRKLYPDATLPKIATERQDAQTLIVTYQSDRHMADLAEGLIHGAIAHFATPVSCTRVDLPDQDTKQCATFQLKMIA